MIMVSLVAFFLAGLMAAHSCILESESVAQS